MKNIILNQRAERDELMARPYLTLKLYSIPLRRISYNRPTDPYTKTHGAKSIYL
ncbi:MAG: hypothetical protein HDR48_01260 [Bacteroides sp.]|nr:hypothetical protein [Bacteroides sp.]